MAHRWSRSTTTIMRLLPSDVVGRFRPPAAAATAALPQLERLANTAATSISHHQRRSTAASFSTTVAPGLPTRGPTGGRWHSATTVVVPKNPSAASSPMASSSLAGPSFVPPPPPHQHTTRLRRQWYSSTSVSSFSRNKSSSRNKGSSRHNSPSTNNHDDDDDDDDDSVRPNLQDWSDTDETNAYYPKDGTYTFFSGGSHNYPTATDNDEDDNKDYDDNDNDDNDGKDHGNKGYVSPMQDWWDLVDANSTTLGLDELETTDYDDQGRPLHQVEPRLPCGIPDAKLRFTTSSYGRLINAPHVHSQEHQVTLKVNTRWVPLQGMEWDILREIVGPRRFNEEKHELRLTSDRFGSRIENKRHLVSMLDRIVSSCQKLGREMAQQLPAPPSPSTLPASAPSSVAASSSSSSTNSSSSSSSSPN